MLKKIVHKNSVNFYKKLLQFRINDVLQDKISNINTSKYYISPAKQDSARVSYCEQLIS